VWAKDLEEFCLTIDDPSIPAEEIKRTEKLIMQGNCIGYIYGYLGYHNISGLEKGPSRSLCLPTPPDINVLRHVFLDYVAQTPSMRNLPASLVMYQALVRTYPCAQ
jgi:hypothetical protein